MSWHPQKRNPSIQTSKHEYSNNCFQTNKIKNINEIIPVFSQRKCRVSASPLPSGGSVPAFGGNPVGYSAATRNEAIQRSEILGMTHQM